MSTLHIALAIVTRDNQVLVAKRHKEAHQGGLWEFPGGKVEADETGEQGMARELLEEVGLTASNWQGFDDITHDYGDRKVRLETFLVTGFEGEPEGREGNPLQWWPITTLNELPMPKGNVALVEKLMARPVF